MGTAYRCPWLQLYIETQMLRAESISGILWRLCGQGTGRWIVAKSAVGVCGLGEVGVAHCLENGEEGLARNHARLSRRGSAILRGWKEWLG